MNNREAVIKIQSQLRDYLTIISVSGDSFVFINSQIFLNK